MLKSAALEGAKASEVVCLVAPEDSPLGDLSGLPFLAEPGLSEEDGEEVMARF